MQQNEELTAAAKAWCLPRATTSAQSICFHLAFGQGPHLPPAVVTGDHPQAELLAQPGQVEPLRTGPSLVALA